MSTLLAHAARTQKAGILAIFAVLAVFAAYAGLGLRADSARADVDGQDVNLYGGCPEGTQVGDLCTFALVIDLTQPTAGDLRVTVTLNSSVLGNIAAADDEPLGGDDALCVVSGDDDEILTCTFDGPLANNVQSTLYFVAEVIGNGDYNPVDDLTAQDEGSNDGNVDGVNHTSDSTFYAAEVYNFDKDANGGSFNAGDTVTYTIYFELSNDSYTANAVDLVIEDELDADWFESITSATDDNTDVSCSKSGLTVTCEADTFDAGDDVTITIVAVLRSAEELVDDGVIGWDDSESVNNEAVASWNTEDGDGECSTNGLNEDVFDELDCVGTVSASATATADADTDIIVHTPTGPERDFLCEGIFHVGPVWNAEIAEWEMSLLIGDWDDDWDCWKAAPRDVNNNVVGAAHYACVIGYDDRMTNLSVADKSNYLLGVQPPNTTGERWWITTVAGQANVQGTATDRHDIGPWVYDENGKPLFTEYANAEDVQCVRWYSTAPGEQNIVIVDELGRVIADWANGKTDGDDLRDGEGEYISTHTPLVKEWNILIPTKITKDASFSGTNLDGASLTVPAIFNPATGDLRGTSPSWYEHVLGSHVNNPGPQESVLTAEMIGARLAITVYGCGVLEIRQSDINLDTPVPAADNVVIFAKPGGTTVTGTTVGKPIWFRFHTTYDTFNATYNGNAGGLVDGGVWDGHTSGVDDCDQSGSMTWVEFQADYPNYLGSVNPPKPAKETVKVTWVNQPAQKKVFLAWAGQRIILEHDWRIPAGDNPDGSNVGSCPFIEFGEEDDYVWAAHWVKGGGPGNFISGLGAYVEDPDDAYTFIHDGPGAEESQKQDAPGRPYGACISRVLYESEQPGQVDIELFSGSIFGPDLDFPGGPFDLDQFEDWVRRGIYTPDQTKVAFVVYYMKLNTVTTSLVTQVSKPSHNGSVVSDYAPGNPWDASKDDADNAADWNVSKDILVRIRVTGWFINENPSGRAADTSNPLNVLPANRWVMPDDWALLAGGPADPADGSDARGTAEEFRPQYDIMIAPNNASGIALTHPTGAAPVLAAVVVANASNTTSTFQVSTLGNLAGASITIGTGTTVYTVTAVDPVTGFITISSALAAVPAAGTSIFVVNGTPFEGPYSLIDLPGLCALGQCGAALSNFAGKTTSFVRDTILKDGDVDRWDAPMPPALVSVKLRGTGFIKQVWKEDVYYNGTANSTAQVYPNPFYYSNIPDSPYIPAVVAGGGYLWDSWGDDGPAALGGFGSDLQTVTSGLQGQGPYHFWGFVRRDANAEGFGEALSTTDRAELAAIRTAYGDDSITRDAVVYTDNHGEAMVTANGDFKTDLTACASNVLGGGKHCKPGDVVGKATITATADYPDFRGKHFPVQSNAATVNWTWGGYKDVTVEAGEDPQYKYIVFHAMDRDGFCAPPTGGVLLHPVLSSEDEKNTIGLVDPVETVDFLIDSGQGIILNRSGDTGALNVDGNRQFATGIRTYSLALNTTIKEFPVSSLAPAGQTDECQAWIRVSNSLLSVVNVLVFAKDDEGTIGFDRVIDLQTTTKLTLNFRWSLVTWSGADNIKVSDALSGTGANDAGNDISAEVTAIYGWDAAAQDWLGYFPAGVSVPGANDLVNLKKGSAYWIAIKGPAAVEWTIATNVG